MKTGMLLQTHYEVKAFKKGLKPAIFEGFWGTLSEGKVHLAPANTLKRELKNRIRLAMLRHVSKGHSCLMVQRRFGKQGEDNVAILITQDPQRLKRFNFTEKDLDSTQNDAKIGRILGLSDFAIRDFVKQAFPKYKVQIKSRGLIFSMQRAPGRKQLLRRWAKQRGISRGDIQIR